MITYKSNGLSKKEAQIIYSLLQDVKDIYSDGYITRENIRLFIKDNIDVFLNCLKQGDKVAFTETGLVTVIGFSDKAPRKYMKVLVKDLDEVPDLVKSLFWHIKEDIFCKVKNNNPLKDKLLKSGFLFVGGRGREVLLVHRYVARPSTEHTFLKDRDENFNDK
jgi:hypothetical protein